MAVESGLYGNAMVSNDGTTGWSRVIELIEWTCNRDVKESPYASNMTRGRIRRTTGAEDCKGTFKCVHNASTPAEVQLEPGDRVKVRLYREALKGHELWVKILGGPDQTVNVGEGNTIESSYSWAADDDQPLFNTTLAAIAALP